MNDWLPTSDPYQMIVYINFIGISIKSKTADMILAMEWSCHLVIGLSFICFLQRSFAATLKEKTPEEIQEDINEIQKKITGDDPRSQTLRETLDTLKGTVSTTTKEPENKKKVETAISTIGGVIDKFQSDDPLEIANGCFEMLVGFADIAKPLAALSPLFQFISLVIGIVGSGKTEESVGDIIEKALTEQRDKELEDLALSTKLVLGTSKAFLDGMKLSDGTLSETEVSALAANIPIYQGVKMISLLMERIKRAKPKTATEAERILSLAELLIDLISFRDFIVTDLYCMIAQANHSPRIAAGVNGVRKVTQERLRVVMKDVLRGDDPDRWLLLSYLYPKDRSNQTIKIFRFFKSAGITDLPGINIDVSGKKIFSTLRWPDYCMRAQYDRTYMLGNEIIKKTKKDCHMSLFKLDDGFYKIVDSRNRIAYAGDKKIHLGTAEVDDLYKFSFIPVRKDGKVAYLLSNYNWPSKFAYMWNHGSGTTYFHEGIPSSWEQYIWTIKNL